MPLLTVPNWSFGRDRDLLQLFRDLLEGWDLQIHFLESDLDHNRTVSAFSGDPEVVLERLTRLAEAAFERIDLNRHIGVHPRIGALDVCPFLWIGDETYPLKTKVDLFAKQFAQKFQVPVFLYEQSEKGKHSADLPALRRKGFGGLQMQEITPDYGPTQVHQRLGATVMGVRDFLIAMNVNFWGPDLALAKRVAAEIRKRRDEGQAGLRGVRALGFPLQSREQVQVSINLTEPNVTPPDAVIETVLELATKFGLKHAGNELIGVIRECDLSRSTRLPIQPQQVVRGFS